MRATPPPAPPPPVWSARQWCYGIGLVLAAHIAAIWLLSERVAKAPSLRAPDPVFALPVQEDSRRQMVDWPGLSDPTLFVLPSLRNFSGPAWFQFAPLQFAPTNHPEPLRWLTQDPAQLGRTFSPQDASGLSMPSRLAEEPMPKFTGEELRIGTLPWLGKSELRIEGELARRPLRTPAALPAWPAADLLTNTVVQLWVDGSGRALSATLLGACGLKSADDFAMKLATTAEFQPDEPAPRQAAASPLIGLAWGRLVFQWYTLPPGATNLPAGSPAR